MQCRRPMPIARLTPKTKTAEGFNTCMEVVCPQWLDEVVPYAQTEGPDCKPLRVALGNHQHGQIGVVQCGLLQNNQMVCLRDIELKAQKIRLASPNMGRDVARLTQVARVIQGNE